MTGVLAVVACSSSAPVATRPPPLTPDRPPEEPAFDPPAPALRLPTHFVPQSYAARLAVDPAQPGFRGEIAITGELTKRSPVIWLHGKDLELGEAHAERGGQTFKLVAAAHGDGLIEVRAFAPISAGPLTIRIAYRGTVGKDVRGLFRNDRGADAYLVTYFEPIGARRVFPCFDEPAYKTPWTLTLDVPTGMVAVSNTPSVRSEPVDATHTRVTFAPTLPLPSYLIALGVGPFEVVDAGAAKSGVPLRLIVPRGTTPSTDFARTALPRVIDVLETWFASPLPYPKLDILAVPAMGGGAMEHAGLITADASYVLLDPAKMSWQQRRESIVTLGHEAAHQWFGDLVTPGWWDDTWLKESFATWMEPKVTAAFDASWHDEQAGVSRRNWALSVDVQVSARKIRQPIVKGDEIQETFDAITYAKGGAILAQFERYLGADVFQAGVRAYLKTHAHGNAVAADLIGALETASGKPLAAAFATFLDQPGVPVFDIALDCGGGAPRVRVAQQRYLKPGSGTPAPTQPWHVPVCIAYDKGGARGEVCKLVDAERAEIELPLRACPKWVMPNAGGLGYYYAAIDEAAAVALRDVGWKWLSAEERRVVFEDVRGRVVKAELPVALLMSLVPKLVAAGDRFAMNDALGDGGLPREIGNGLPPDVAREVAAWQRATYGALAKKRDFLARPTDSIHDESTRYGLVAAAAWAGDAVLVARAVKLAKAYRDLPQSTRELVLPIAANASPAISDQLHADAVGEPDHDLRLLQLRALAAIEDPARARAARSLALDPRIPNEDVVNFLYSARPGAAAREAVQWFQANAVAVLARFPKDDTFAPFLLYAFEVCDAERRDAVVAFMTEHFGKMTSAGKVLRQRIEAIDQCIAQQKIVEPSLRAWITKKR